jgi:hypothetical protein
MRNIQKETSKIKPSFKLSEDFLDLKTFDTNVIIKKLEDTMKLREMKIEKRIEREFKKI